MLEACPASTLLRDLRRWEYPGISLVWHAVWPRRVAVRQLLPNAPRGGARPGGAQAGAMGFSQWTCKVISLRCPLPCLVQSLLSIVETHTVTTQCLGGRKRDGTTRSDMVEAGDACLLVSL